MDVKYLNEEVGKWQGTTKYLEAKRLLSDPKNSSVWRNKYASRRSVGSCVYLCDMFQPTSYQDFYEKYIQSGEDDSTTDVRFKGRTLDEIEEIAKKWHDDVGDGVHSLETYFYGVIVHVIIETFQGAAHEQAAMNQLQKAGFKVSKGTDDEDALMNIDIKVSDKDGNLKYLLQVKPLSFITSYRSDTVLDKINAFEKEKMAKIAYPSVQLFYLLYDAATDKWIFNVDKGRCTFAYEELVKPNGLPVKSAKVLRSCEVDELGKKY